MRTSALLFAFVLAASGCSKQPQRTSTSTLALPPRLESYFEQYCDYTGSMGIGFDPSHTYDYRFRQHLKETRDPELKRLFVLQHLHQDLERALQDFEKGIVWTGKSSSRSLTLSEWHDTQKNIQTQIDDLATFQAFTNFTTPRLDPFDRRDSQSELRWVEELRGKLRSITNAPAANNSAAANSPPSTTGPFGAIAHPEKFQRSTDDRF